MLLRETQSWIRLPWVEPDVPIGLTFNEWTKPDETSGSTLPLQPLQRHQRAVQMNRALQ